jgi:hypothetical protein
MEFIDDDGCIIVPRSIRPIIDYPQTILGNGNGALKQFRLGKLHIREYADHYSVHSDKIDPMKDPVGHLMVDAPEYLAGILYGISTYSYLKNKSPNYLKKANRNSNFSSEQERTTSSPYLATILAAFCGYRITKSLKKLSQQG